MSVAVTVDTERDQIVELIVAELASFGEVVYLQVLWRTAILASPAVPFECLFAEYSVCFGIELLSWAFLLKWRHASWSIPSTGKVKNTYTTVGLLERWHLLENQRRSSPNNSLEIGRSPASERQSRWPAR